MGYYNILSLCSLAFFIRCLFILLGTLIDQSTLNLNYTDIDYFVFSDAATQILNGHSPFERSTYRYPPLIALLLNVNQYNIETGKLIFSVADVFIVYLIFKLHNGSEVDAIRLSSLWAFNPMAINICTRGSADAITNSLVLLSLFLIQRKSALIGGIIFGTVVHLRIYPVIYLPSFLMHLYFAKLDDNKPDRDVQYSNQAQNVYFSRNVYYCLLFLFGSFVSLSACTMSSYLYYGQPFLDHAIFYHLTRSDHRHNFSPHFYWMYLSQPTIDGYDGSNSVVPNVVLSAENVFNVVQTVVDRFTLHLRATTQISDYVIASILLVMSKLILFVPQIVILCTLTYKYATTQLSLCLLLQTMVFVAYNKVITAQYFTWFLCLLPSCVPVLVQSIPRKSALISGVFWSVSLAWWLYNAYLLEFHGENTFMAIWIAGLVFHVANVVCISTIIYHT